MKYLNIHISPLYTPVTADPRYVLIILDSLCHFSGQSDVHAEVDSTAQLTLKLKCTYKHDL